MVSEKLMREEWRVLLRLLGGLELLDPDWFRQKETITFNAKKLRGEEVPFIANVKKDAEGLIKIGSPST